MKVIIAGGGIGGLTTAIALQQRGITCEVYDAAPANKALGAGIMLAPNAMTVFDKLGVGHALRAHGAVARQFYIRYYKGDVLQHIDGSLLQQKFGSASYGIHRAALQQQLIEAVQTPVHWGKRCTRAEQTAEGVTVHFEDGTTASGNVLVGADGIHSVLREQHVAKARYRYSGQTCWRAIVPVNLPEREAAEASEVWGNGNGLRAMCMQVGPQQVYFWMTKRMPAGLKIPPEEALAFIKKELRHFPGYMHNVMEHLQPEALIHSDLYDIAPMRQWYNGRIVLLGDAAHATTPNLGQGAGQAIEDAYVLAKWLATEKNITSAFEKYQRQRRKRVHMLVRTSWQLARITNWKGPLLAALRNTLLKSVPAGIAEKQIDLVYGVQLD
ncbi:FAD-dependent monooxygenase [Chitinophaga alhagiae]|uniref:FAD-dependent monooxygenase n=1 Tax=Chitinophaga alhagiae TaxID=2203219 RepID=UPI000E5C48F3|nr:FAD-dependent monooxygenase [Chitinophaga alhagiae]